MNVWNQLQYVYNYSKNLTADINDCVWKEEYLAMSNGTSIISQMTDLYINGESITVDATGKGTLSKVPVTDTNIYVELPDGTTQIITPSISGSTATITVTGFINGEVLATYRYNDTVDTITIQAGKVPVAYDVTLIAKIFNDAGQNKELQINIPKLKFDGNFDLSLTAEGVVAPKITGKALADAKGNYAIVKVKTLDTTSVSINQIAVTTPTVALTSTNNSKLLQVIGIRGGMYANVSVPMSDLTITSSAMAICKVNATTKALEFVAAGTATITVALTSDPTILDIVEVTCS